MQIIDSPIKFHKKKAAITIAAFFNLFAKIITYRFPEPGR